MMAAFLPDVEATNDSTLLELIEAKYLKLLIASCAYSVYIY